MVVKKKKIRNGRLDRFILFLFLSLFMAAGIGFTVLFRQTYREYTTLKTRQALHQQRLSDAEANLKEKEVRLYRLRHDPAYIERTIRQLLGYAKPGELVFRFEEHEEPMP